jgi:hypothetical protein
MPLPDSAPTSVLREFLFSEEEPARRVRRHRRSPQRRRLDLYFWRSNQFHESEEGMLTLATVITVLGLVVLIAFLGNIGETVVEKIEMQNDADAAAYSSALWMARGMNAVTTTNHLLGEVTALCVIHEAFGGPELDNAGPGWPSEQHNDVKSLNNDIRQLKDTAPVTDKSPYWPLGPAHRLDKQLIDFAVDNMADKNERYFAGATIYDAKLNLKRQLLQMMRLKSLANLGYFVPPFIGPVPVGVVTAAAASLVHIYASAQIVLMVKEWMLIGLIQTAAIAMSEAKSTMERSLIPALVRYEETIAKSSTGGGSVILQQRVQAALDSLDGRRGTELSTFPAPRDLTLPLVKEPEPQGGGVPNWGDDPLSDTSLDAEFEQQLKNMQGALNEASDKDDRPQKLENAKQATEDIKTAQKEIDTEVAKKKAAEEKAKAAEEQAKADNKPVPKPTPEEEAAKQESDQKIAAAEEKQRIATEKRAKQINGMIVKVDPNAKLGVPGAASSTPESELVNAEPVDDDGSESGGQFRDPEQLQKDVDRLEKLDNDITQMLGDKEAKLTPKETEDLNVAQKQIQGELKQRRKELQSAQNSEGNGKMNSLQGMGDKNPSSKNLMRVQFNEEQETHTQWMRAAYPHLDALRAPILGMMNDHLEKSRAEQSYRVWSERYIKVKTFQFRAGKKWSSAGPPNLLFNSSSPGKMNMYVLKDTYQNNSGTKPLKGFEPWRKGVEPAEKYFTVMGFAYRPAHDGLFADVLFKSAHVEGNLAISQAMVYNASLERLPGSDDPGSVQPSVSWDTLNWEIPVQAPEYGNISGASGSIWPWDLFESSNKTGASRNKIKLNWQAKLVPVTETRAKPARNNSKVPAGVRKVLDRSKKNFDSLIQH